MFYLDPLSLNLDPFALDLEPLSFFMDLLLSYLDLDPNLYSLDPDKGKDKDIYETKILETCDRPLRHLIRVMRTEGTLKETMTNTNTNTRP